MKKIFLSKKFSIFQKIILGLIIFLCLGSNVQAEKNIEWAEADQLYVFVGTPTQITITAKIAEDPALIPTSVYLYKYNENGRPIANMGRLYDDATHGDILANDNRFTTQITFNETEMGELRFKVTVAYRRTLRRLQSDYIILQAKTKADPEEVRAKFIEVLRTGSIEDIMSYFAPDDKRTKEYFSSITTEKRNKLAEWIQIAELTHETEEARYYQYLLLVGGTIKFEMFLTIDGNWVFVL